MLFRKKIPVSCTYCAYSAQFAEKGQILCSKKGVTAPKDSCRSFRYAPCKRIPVKPKAQDFSKYDKEDFSL